MELNYEKIKRDMISYIEEDPEWYNLSDLITSWYFSDIEKAYRYIQDVSRATKQDWTLLFLDFRTDTYWCGDWDKYLWAFLNVKVWEDYLTVMYDKTVRENFNTIEDFVDTIIDLQKDAYRLKSVFNNLRPVYTNGWQQ